jgi:hypothetical protein
MIPEARACSIPDQPDILRERRGPGVVDAEALPIRGGGGCHACRVLRTWACWRMAARRWSIGRLSHTWLNATPGSRRVTVQLSTSSRPPERIVG